MATILTHRGQYVYFEETVFHCSPSYEPISFRPNLVLKPQPGSSLMTGSVRNISAARAEALCQNLDFPLEEVSVAT
ncbi:hypothetical protein BWQ96_07312 [Gracilariopsis chorda]|uniref:Uncharacterized protein n=1 Tax=Gracilariopsis chorda TaxID=448386 RepID=A0A2V3ILG8_9FLOR|nr:hypothetical protein BWQ96_07312 [Gracilariopsis chorda]|eukprot:PXF42934.1 hypothetical protein BWQ96_07312 [Gracilariopsis chorda]